MSTLGRSDLPGAFGVSRGARLRSLSRSIWLRLRHRGRIAVHRDAQLGRGARLEVARGGRLIVGARVSVGRGARLRAAGGTLTIGAGTALGPHSAIVAHREVGLGRECLVGDGAMLIDAEPVSADPERPIRAQGVRIAPVRMGDGVRVGAFACVHPGVTLGTGCRVAPRAVVTGDVPAGGLSLGSRPTEPALVRPGLAAARRRARLSGARRRTGRSSARARSPRSRPGRAGRRR